MMPEYWTMKYSALLYTFFELLTFQSTPTISDLGAKLGIVKDVSCLRIQDKCDVVYYKAFFQHNSMVQVHASLYQQGPTGDVCKLSREVKNQSSKCSLYIR